MKKLLIVLILLLLSVGGHKVIAAEDFDTPVDTYVQTEDDIKAQKIAEKEAAKKLKKEEKEKAKKEREAARLEKKKAAEEEKSKRIGRKFFSKTEKDDIPDDEVFNKDESESIVETDGVKVDKKKDKKSDTAEKNVEQSTDVVVDSDTIEYFPERHEFEALGHAKVFFPTEKSTLLADKIIFNHDTNYVKGYDNVVLIRDGQKVYGDYVQIDLNEENALLTNPVMHRMNIKIQAKNANVYDAKTEAMDGTAKFEGEGGMYKFVSRSIFGFHEPILPEAIEKSYVLKEKFDNKWNLKAHKIIIDSYKDHDIATLVNTDIYLKGHKVARAGKIRLFTNKAQDYIETNMIELGTMRNVGAYVAPSIVLPVPGGATFKIGPALTYKNDLGVGAIGRFMSATNKTAFGYGSSVSRFVVRGEQKFTDNLHLEYAANTYMNEWFMGGRMPQHGFQFVYKKRYNLDDIGVMFENRFSTGYAKDWKRNFGTTRTRWQTQATKEILEYKDLDHDFAAKFGAIVQSTTSLYGTGDVYGLVRIGPTLRTQYKNWQQYAAYYLGAEAGESPMQFDRFYYSKSSVQLGESLRLNKYITLMYSAMIALGETPNHKLLQENRFYVAFGPDDFKILLGYDAYRQNTVFGIDMAIGADNSELEYKRLVLNEPEKMGKSNKKKKVKKVSNKQVQQKQKIESNPMDKSVRDYDDYNPGFNMMNNTIIQPSMIRPPGY